MKSEGEESVKLVFQRFRRASIFIDGKMTGVGSSDPFSCGLLVYVSFAKSATKEKALQAARTIVNLPILTRGAWGDGSSPLSVLDIASSNKNNLAPSLLLVPQANLISKVSECTSYIGLLPGPH